MIANHSYRGLLAIGIISWGASIVLLSCLSISSLYNLGTSDFQLFIIMLLALYSILDTSCRSSLMLKQSRH